MKKYRNRGITDLDLGGKVRRPGAVFTADIPDEQERLLIRGGHLEIVKPPKTKKKDDA